MIDKEKSLAYRFPELAKEWHPVKNGDLTPNDVTVGSNKNVWWIGKCGHEWDSVVKERVRGYGCPVCAGALPVCRRWKDRPAHYSPAGRLLHR